MTGTPPINDELSDIGRAAAMPVTGNGASPVNGKSHPSDKPEELIPDRDMLVRFVDVMFRNARRDGFVSLRAFEDNGSGEKPIFIQALRLDDQEFVPLMLERARQAATWWKPAVFCPPVATFKDHRNAKTDNVREGVALSTECDQTPAKARATLEALLGPATVVVESGGEWINDETGEIEPKLHLHWRLKKPAATPEELAMLYKARSLAATLVGGDTTNNSIVHPIRWPGGWHRKKAPRLARIGAQDDNEIDLEAALERLRAAVGVVEPVRTISPDGGNGSGQRVASDHSVVAHALAAIPNGTDPKAHHWEYWNKIGMTIWASTDGSEAGRVAFHEWSAKSNKYDVVNTEDRWQHYFRSPPTRLGFGTLVYLAREHVPDWRYENPASAAATVAVGEFIAQLLREGDEADDNAGSAGSSGSPGDAGGAAGPGASGGASSAPPLIEARAFVLRDPGTLPKRQWVYGKHLIRKFGSATFAPSGSGKSNLMISEALAMATGRALLGVLPPKRCRVWYWNGEDPMDELERRVGAACLHYGITAAEIDGWLFINSGRETGSRVVIASQDHNGTTIAIPMVEALVRTIHGNKIDVVMIDPFISSHQVPENDNNTIDAVAKTWTGIADVTNTAIDLAHHTRKTGGAEVTVEDGRGAVALLNAVRPARVLNIMTEDEAIKGGVVDGRRRYFRVTDGKNNLALPADKLDWFRSVSIDLGNGDPDDPHDRGDNMGVVTAWQWPNPLDGVSGEDFEKAVAVIRAGEWRLNNQAKAWVGHAVAKALGLGDVRRKGIDRARVIAIVNMWVYKGVLVVVERQDPVTRKAKEYVEVAEDTLGPLQGVRFCAT
jgi:hypothetical protein